MTLSKWFSQIRVWTFIFNQCNGYRLLSNSKHKFKLRAIQITPHIKEWKDLFVIHFFFLQLPSFLCHSHILTDICWKDDKLKNIICVVTWLLLAHNIYLQNVKNALLTQHSSWHLWKVIRTYLYLHSVNTAGKVLLPERLRYLYFL